MKTFLFTACFFLFSFPINLFTQKTLDKKQKIKISGLYLNGGFSVKKNISPGFGLNILLSSNWGGSISYSYIALKVKNLPSAYNQGTCSGGLFCGEPSEYIAEKSVRLIRMFPTTYKYLRFWIEAGFSLIEYSESQFKASNSNSRNYDFSHSKYQTFGISILAKIDLPITKLQGLEF